MTTVNEILKKINPLKFIGNAGDKVSDVIQLDLENKRQDVLFWCSDKNIDVLNKCTNGTVICSEKVETLSSLAGGCNYIIVANPRVAFSQVLKLFFVPKDEQAVVSAKASIHPSAQIGKNVFVGDFTVIEKDCVVGDNSYIGHNNVIHHKTIIGQHVRIGSNNTIGGIGFGYEKGNDGDYEVMPHIGNVVIGDQVEIGNNNCIDRAVLGSTTIHRNVKIDNLIHIAHGAIIGENALIIANSMIGGSAVIGKNTWISPSVSIINKGKIGDGALVGMGAVVLKPVAENTVAVGNPAKFLKNL